MQVVKAPEWMLDAFGATALELGLCSETGGATAPVPVPNESLATAFQPGVAEMLRLVSHLVLWAGESGGGPVTIDVQAGALVLRGQGSTPAEPVSAAARARLVVIRTLADALSLAVDARPEAAEVHLRPVTRASAPTVVAGPPHRSVQPPLGIE